MEALHRRAGVFSPTPEASSTTAFCEELLPTAGRAALTPTRITSAYHTFPAGQVIAVFHIQALRLLQLVELVAKLIFTNLIAGEYYGHETDDGLDITCLNMLSELPHRGRLSKDGFL